MKGGKYTSVCPLFVKVFGNLGNNFGLDLVKFGHCYGTHGFTVSKIFAQPYAKADLRELADFHISFSGRKLLSSTL
jgi:hypothetical protein